MRMWLVNVLPFLLVICPSLTDPSNGMINCSLGGDGVANPGETCTITCNTGYQLMGGVMRACRNDGSWNGSDTICISE